MGYGEITTDQPALRHPDRHQSEQVADITGMRTGDGDSCVATVTKPGSACPDRCKRVSQSADLAEWVFLIGMRKGVNNTDVLAIGATSHERF